MLIIEGPDCSGKTTLAKTVEEMWKVPFLHLGLPPVGIRHWTQVREALLTSPVNAVYDRMVLGSIVFGQVKPDEHNRYPVTENEFEAWVRLINDLPATLVLCIADEDTLLTRFRARGDAYLTEDELTHSIVAYRNLIQRITKNKMVNRCLLYNSQYTTPEAFIRGYEREIAFAIRDGHLPTSEQRTLIHKVMD